MRCSFTLIKVHVGLKLLRDLINYVLSHAAHLGRKEQMSLCVWGSKGVGECCRKQAINKRAGRAAGVEREGEGKMEGGHGGLRGASRRPGGA